MVGDLTGTIRFGFEVWDTAKEVEDFWKKGRIPLEEVLDREV